MERTTLKLYIAGNTVNGSRAISNLRAICREELNDRYEVVIIDVLERPQLAEDERILATPTLIKELPPPLRRVIGDLSNRESVLVGLDLQRAEPSDTEHGRTLAAQQGE